MKRPYAIAGSETTCGIISGMKRKTALILSLVWVFGGSWALAADIEIEASYGYWSLSPFSGVVEQQSREMIETQIEAALGALSYFLDIDRLKSDFSGSDGRYLGLGVWFPAKKRVSLGARVDWLELRMPFTCSFEQHIYVPGLAAVNIFASGNGQVNIDSPMLSLLCRWRAVSGRKLDTFIYTGLSWLPLEGDFSLQGQANVYYSTGKIEEPIVVEKQGLDRLRQDFGMPPKSVLSPWLGVSVHYRPWRTAGLKLDLSFSQGSLLSLGFFYNINK